MPDKPNVYALRRNDVDGALAFIEQHWGNLRPEDFSVLRQLQTNPTEYLRRLDVLEKKLLALKGQPLRRRR
jgi:hypothetical protein